MPSECDVVLFVAKHLAASNANLFTHQVDASDFFGHWMLYLQTSVHLKEVELAGCVVDQELDSAG